MSDDLSIILTDGLVATAAGLLGPFLVLRRVALTSDAVSHAVLPGIVVVWLLFHTRAPLPVIGGAAVFAIICVMAIDALKATGLVKGDAAIALVFPGLFALGVIGITRYASGIHLDLDPRSRARSPSRRSRPSRWAAWRSPARSSCSVGWRLLLVAVAITAVTAFESVGAILVVTLLIVPATTAHLLTDRLWVMVAATLAIGWLSAIAGYRGAVAMDASIVGAMGLVAAACFAVALFASPRYGLIARAVQRRARRRVVHRELAAGRPQEV